MWILISAALIVIAIVIIVIYEQRSRDRRLYSVNTTKSHSSVVVRSEDHYDPPIVFHETIVVSAVDSTPNVPFDDEIRHFSGSDHHWNDHHSSDSSDCSGYDGGDSDFGGDCGGSD